MSVSTSISEQQITDSPNAPQGEDHSNSVNEQPMIGMPLKNRSSADDINDSGGFMSIFDGKPLDDWKIAENGKFVIMEKDASL